MLRLLNFSISLQLLEHWFGAGLLTQVRDPPSSLIWFGWLWGYVQMHSSEEEKAKQFSKLYGGSATKPQEKNLQLKCWVWGMHLVKKVITPFNTFWVDRMLMCLGDRPLLLAKKNIHLGTVYICPNCKYRLQNSSCQTLGKNVWRTTTNLNLIGLKCLSVYSISLFQGQPWTFQSWIPFWMVSVHAPRRSVETR